MMRWCVITVMKKDKRKRGRISMEEENGVSSNIELTEQKAEGRSLSLQKYRSQIRGMARKVERFVLELEPDNLLSAKMVLMGAVKLVEKRLKENREG